MFGSVSKITLFSLHLPGKPLTIYADLYIVDIGEISVTNMVSCCESLETNWFSFPNQTYVH